MQIYVKPSQVLSLTPPLPSGSLLFPKGIAGWRRTHGFFNFRAGVGEVSG
jgi:hypothetical protein